MNVLELYSLMVKPDIIKEFGEFTPETIQLWKDKKRLEI